MSESASSNAPESASESAPQSTPKSGAAHGSETAAGRKPATKGGLSAKLLPELRQIAGGLGIKATGLKKADLVAAIRQAQSGAGGDAREEAGHQDSGHDRARQSHAGQNDAGQDDAGQDDAGQNQQRTRERNRSRDDRDGKGDQGGRENQDKRDQGDRVGRGQRNQDDSNRADQPAGGERANHGRQPEQGKKDASGESQRDGQKDGQKDTRRENQRDNQNSGQNSGQKNGQRDGRSEGQSEGQSDGQSDGQHAQGDNDGNSRRNRRRRGRDRANQGGVSSQAGNQSHQGGGRGHRHEPDLTILEDDILAPCAGILDVLDNYAFVRTSGYLPGTDDVYVSMSMVRRFGLRRGDAITGQVRQPREGERKEKFNPLVQLDSVNGAEPEPGVDRVDFAKLTPLYPSERLRLETTPANLIGRVIDIAAPIGKGQRGLIVSPAKAGKTMILQSIADSITTNNPEVHLMVVLVDERPEEVTDFQRSVRGEVISSTFDRPASDHTMAAELAIERAKRLVELGHDVVVLLDGITRLGRAYNQAMPASGRILSGGVDSAALYPPKKFFGAARNIEGGGSLTILATALIESGSKMDEVIFEEFKGTGNMEIRLRREFADKRIFPAIDAVQSGTRREELLMSEEELAIVWKLRRALSGLESQQALELLLARLRKTDTNIEFLKQVQQTTPGLVDKD